MGEGIKEVLGEYLTDTIEQLVDNPEAVEVNIVISTKTITAHVKVDSSECGKIIGKKGRTINALNIIALAIKNTQYPDDIRKVSVEVVEDENTQRRFR